MKFLTCTTAASVLLLAGSVAPLPADFETARRDLIDARTSYRQQFAIDQNYDSMMQRWRNAEYDLRTTLLSARDEFLAVADGGTGPTQAARQGAAEAINEIVSAQFSEGNVQLIKSLLTRYPTLNPGTGPEDGERGFALGPTGNLRDETEEIDRAIETLGIGLKAALTVFDRPDVTYDSGYGILRAEDPAAPDTFSGFPYFMDMPFTADSEELAVLFEDAQGNTLTPASMPYQVELSQMGRLLDRYGQAQVEKAKKLFNLSVTLDPDEDEPAFMANFNDPTARQEAQDALKAGTHTAYLTAVGLAAIQTPEQYEQNKTNRVNIHVGNARLLHADIIDPSVNPLGNGGQFVPADAGGIQATVSNYLNLAATSIGEAAQAELSLRSQQRDYNARQAEIGNITESLDDRLSGLRSLTGLDPSLPPYNGLRRLEEQRAFRAEVRRRTDLILAAFTSGGYEPGGSVQDPGLNQPVVLGQFGQQLYRVLDASFAIQEAYNNLANIPRRIEIEQERAGQVVNVTLSTGDKLAVIDYALGVANSFTVSVGLVGPKPTTEVTFNPGAIVSGVLRGQQTLLRAAQSAEIEQINSAATIKTLLLEQANAEISLRRAKAVFDAELTSYEQLFVEVDNQIEEYVEASVVAQDSLDLHFNNPEYQIWLNTAQRRALARLDDAIRDTYSAGRALAYYWTEDYRNPVVSPNNYNGDVTLPDYYANFGELEDVFSAGGADSVGDFYVALRRWDNLLRGSDGNSIPLRGPTFQNGSLFELSVRDAIFIDDEGNPAGSLNYRIRNLRDLLNRNAVRFGDAPSPGFVLPLSLTIDSNQYFSAAQFWNLRIGRTADDPNAGVQIDIEADSGLMPSPSDDIVALAFVQSGTVAAHNYFNRQVPVTVPQQWDGVITIDEVVSRYTIPSLVQPFDIWRQGTYAFVPAAINGRYRVAGPGGVPQDYYTNKNLNGKPVSATQWLLFLDSSLTENRGVDIAKIRDIKLKFSTTNGNPPPFSFPPLPALD